MTPATERLYAAAIASAKVGTGFFFLLNTWLIIGISGRPSSAAISLIMTILPSLLLSPIIGVVADRGVPGRLAYCAEFFRCAVLATYGMLYSFGSVTEPLGYAVSFCIALGNETQVIAWRAALTRAVERDQLLRLNALTVVGGQSGQIFGAAASGFVLAATGPVFTIALTGCAYLVSALISLVVARRLASLGNLAGGLTTKPDYLEDLRAGLAHIAKHPHIAFFYGLILANMTVVFGINAMLAPFVQDVLRLGSSAFGVIDAGYAFGAIFGGLCIGRLSARFGRRAILLGGLLTACVGLLMFSQSHGIIFATVSYILLGISFQTSIVSLSAAQEATENEYQGRVSAAFNALNGLAGLIVYAGVAFVASQHPYRVLYLAQAAGMLMLVPMVLIASTRPAIRHFLKPTRRTPSASDAFIQNPEITRKLGPQEHTGRS